MEKEWEILATDRKKCKALARDAGISEVIAALLQHRGIETKDAAETFLHSEQQEFYDPYRMKDMETAVERIAVAIEGGENIVIYGDYDADGITATAVLLRSLRRLGAKVSFYIPDRMAEGYGLNLDALQRIAGSGADLLVTVDCGISNIEEIAAMQGKLDIVVTDHHLPGENLPAAVAVVNPHRKDCAYPYKELCGAGIAFKLSQALWRELRDTDSAGFTDDLEIAALGTVADVVPLLDENRRIVADGLAKMPDTPCTGLAALIKAAGLEGSISSRQVAFGLAPRLNAIGRLASARRGVELFLTEDAEQAAAIATELCDANARRQAMEQEILDGAEKMMQSYDLQRHHVILLAGEGWHPGIIGIVASRILEKYYRPVILISLHDGIGRGSCRSIAGYHMRDALASAQELLLIFGGHAQAAGFSLAQENVDALRDALDAWAEEHLAPEDYVPKVKIEFELNPLDVSLDLIEDLSALEPYGEGNEKPCFGCRDVRGSFARVIGKEGQHLKFRIGDREHSVDAVCWRGAPYGALVNARPLDIIYVPEINEWNGKKSVQCVIDSFATSKSDRIFPDRAILGKIYLFLRREGQQGNGIPADSIKLVENYMREAEYISMYTMEKALTIFQEIGLLVRSGEACHLATLTPGTKLDLHASSTFCNGRKEEEAN